MNNETPKNDYSDYGFNTFDIGIGYPQDTDSNSLINNFSPQIPSINNPVNQFEESVESKFEPNKCIYCKKESNLINCVNCKAEIHPYCLDHIAKNCLNCSTPYNKADYNYYCSICGRNIVNITEIQYCNHVYCKSCQEINLNCKYCLNFEIISPVVISDVKEFNFACNQCNNKLILEGRNYKCLHNHCSFCAICKMNSHTGSCVINDNAKDITCSICLNLAKKNQNSFIYSCSTCNQYYCIVCYEPLLKKSHANCAFLYCCK